MLDSDNSDADSDAKQEKLWSLCMIMRSVHALAETAWPRNDAGESEMPEVGLHAIMDVQTAACAALGLPKDLDLMTGDPTIDF